MLNNNNKCWTIDPIDNGDLTCATYEQNNIRKHSMSSMHFKCSKTMKIRNPPTESNATKKKKKKSVIQLINSTFFLCFFSFQKIDLENHICKSWRKFFFHDFRM